MITITSTRRYQNEINYKDIKNIAKTLLQKMRPDCETDLTIHFCGERKIQRINQEFRNINESTDVLSFFAGEITPETNTFYLGDIIISFPDALKNAKFHRKSINYEILLLVVHGILHLLGFDHDTIERKLQMWEIQEKLLSESCS